MKPNVLQAKDVRVTIATGGHEKEVVRGISFSLPSGGILAVIGESGAGKSVLSHALLRIPPTPQARFLAGEVWLDGKNLAQCDAAALEKMRGSRIAMMFQDPGKALDPRRPTLRQVCTVLRVHLGLSNKEAMTRAEALIADLGLSPVLFRQRYPHELSGGMRQIAYLAMVLACPAPVLVLDEPTASLDALTKQRVMETLLAERTEKGRSFVLATHDIALASLVADQLLVMYGGMGVEFLPSDRVRRASHPYSRQLVLCTPALSPGALPKPERQIDHAGIPAVGCPFYHRCPSAQGKCLEQPLPRVWFDNQHWVNCHFPIGSAS